MVTSCYEQSRGVVTVSKNASSPASSGPAGSHFEGQVAAHYFLTMLVGAAPRGLPGTIVDRVELQRASEGRSLDDITVLAHDSRGNRAVLEIQVKRSITFAPSDTVFQKVVGQIAEDSSNPDLWSTRYELAVATARSSWKISGAYQDVLTWARQIGDAETFMARISRAGSANDDMRSFVNTFQSHLRDTGALHDDETVWSLLRKLQLLVFDFTTSGSASEELARERAVRILHPEDAHQAPALWAALVDLALKVGASGGDRTREELRDNLSNKGFRLAGERRFAPVRAVLEEASRHVLADINNSIGNISLSRVEYLAEVHAALETDRYIEIIGDAGVGKSGVLKHFAEQAAVQAQVVVLSPGRTIPRGWTSMRAEIGFDGTAHELLADLASDGGGILFFDNLNFFNEEEQRTVVDLVRVASDIPDLKIVTTARKGFGVEELSWLPSDALDRLGRAQPIVIDELSEAEIEDLRHVSPELARFLHRNHPAHAVTRNLFRLAHLASQSSEEPSPQTEFDMAQRWWQTADCQTTCDRRVCARLLRALAEHTLSSVEPLDTSSHPANAVDALIRSETLLDLGNERVTFRHDVLRDWAVANLLQAEPNRIEVLPLGLPLTTPVARGVELYARSLLERSTDDRAWRSLLQNLSREGVHGSWRRTVLLAVIRSEVGYDLLERTSGFLLSDRGENLRELIRTVLAVEVQPASRVFADIGLDSINVPEGLNVPKGPSWMRLITWLINLRDRIPRAAIPEVISLYTTWSFGMLGLDTVTPLLLGWLYQWLIEIETSYYDSNSHEIRLPFGGEFDRDRIRLMESELRSSFLSFCHQTPELAAAYLRKVERYRHNHEVVSSILKFRGNLAQAAPKELAELTESVLLKEYRDSERPRMRPFRHFDNKFLPPSPAQGPFFDLLRRAPQYGLPLIRRLVDHAIAFYSRDCDYATEALTLVFRDGQRTFPWKQSYPWSRDWGSQHDCLTSALMALEAWAHHRVEAKEPFENVLSEVLGPNDSPAAFLLIAVDLVLSHWPNSREAAIPFLSCPELLCIDRERQVQDSIPQPDFFGFKSLEKEPTGAVSLEVINRRASRRSTLEDLLGRYAISDPEELGNRLRTDLRQAADKLGPPSEQADLGDPAFMAFHALNLADPTNWRETSFTDAAGIQKAGYEYVPPDAEAKQLAALQEAYQGSLENTNMQLAIGMVLDDPSRSTEAFVAEAVEWALRTMDRPRDHDSDENRMQERAIIGAAMIAMRDGNPEFRARHVSWARDVFAQAFRTPEDSVHRFRTGIQYNPIAIAFVGMIHLLKEHITSEDMRSLFEVAASGDPAAAHGFGSAAITLASIDERLPPALLRCAFTACIRTKRGRDTHEEEAQARAELTRKRVHAAVEDELKWISNEGHEPSWPDFPTEFVQRRRGIQIPRAKREELHNHFQPSPPDEYIDHQAASLWLRNAMVLLNSIIRPWFLDIVRRYSVWTAKANGAGLEWHEEVYNGHDEWNSAYYRLVANCLSSLELSDIQGLILSKIITLPDESFYDVISVFIRSVDAIYFSDRGLQEEKAIAIREALAERMISSNGWKHLVQSRSSSIEHHIGPAIGVLFFNDYYMAQSPKCYLNPDVIERTTPFLPIFQKLVENGPSIFVAIITLNFLEVSPKSEHLPLIVSAAKAWLVKYPDDSGFWLDYHIGARTCRLIELICNENPSLLQTEDELKMDIYHLLAAFVKLGVAHASDLERSIGVDGI